MHANAKAAKNSQSKTTSRGIKLQNQQQHKNTQQKNDNKHESQQQRQKRKEQNKQENLRTQYQKNNKTAFVKAEAPKATNKTSKNHPPGRKSTKGPTKFSSIWV